MNLVIFFSSSLKLPTEQVFKVVLNTGENRKQFDKCIFDNIPQLGLLVSS